MRAEFRFLSPVIASAERRAEIRFLLKEKRILSRFAFRMTSRLVIATTVKCAINCCPVIAKEQSDCGGLACRLGRCFCFAEVSTGHPHRNDRATAYCTHHTVFVATKRLVILSAEHERIRNTLQKKETDCHTPYGARNDRRCGKNGLPQPLTRLRNDIWGGLPHRTTGTV